jgi:hypothetical protein
MLSTQTAGLTDKRKWQIRRIFIQRRSDYSTLEASRLLSIPRKDLLAKRDDLTVTIEQDRMPWESVAFLALKQWPIEVVYEALGNDADRVIPHLLRLEDLSVRIPAYIVRLLRYLAEAEGVSVDEYVGRALREVADETHMLHPARCAAVPGFTAAHFFPWKPPQ